MGRSSLLVVDVVPWGRVREPAGLAPEALQERECSCRGFFARSTSVRVLVLTGIDNVSAGFGGTTHM
jgi:hypothetical protein